MRLNFLSGQILAFDKPLGKTSFQLVAAVRRSLTKAMGGTKIRVGHAGTLDPLATGVLLLCTGRATKQVERLQAGVKEYVADLYLGATTASFDLELPIDKTYPTDHLSEAGIRATLPRFVGDILQVPPAFSACKIDGDRAYELARKGKEVKLKAKPLRIDSLAIEELKLPHHLRLRIVCSKGTYIRALARDIGEALGTGAHLTALRRTQVGHYRESDCWTLDSFEAWLETQTLDTTPPDGPIPKEFPSLKPQS